MTDLDAHRASCPHGDSLWGRCADCGMTWAEQTGAQLRARAPEQLCEIDLTTGWCSVHRTDCGPQREFEALEYVADETDHDAYPPDRKQLGRGRVPDEIRRPFALLDDQGEQR